MKSFQDMVEDTLLKDGPVLSSILAKNLEASGLTPEAARQRISRANGKVRRLSGLPFPKRASILYHEATYNSGKYWNQLVKITIGSSPAYGPALAAVMARDGIVPEAHFAIISGSPQAQKGQLASETVLSRLVANGFFKRLHIEGIGPCIALDANGQLQHAKSTELTARLVTENMMLLAVRDWARNLGMASYDKITLRTDAKLPKYGTFNWDLCGPSYIRPLATREKDGKPTPGFFLCDVMAGNAINANGIAAFVRKCSMLSGLKNLPPMMPMLLADGFTREAFNLGRGHGILMTTPTNLFGAEVATGLRTLLQSVTKAAAVATEQPEVIPELFSKLSHIEGAAANLRGALFEMIMGHVVYAREADPIEIGKRIKDPLSGASAEIDVFRVKERQGVWIYEGKGHQPSEIVDLVTVEKWVKDRVALIYRVLSAEPRFRESEFHFEYWTCGTFSAEARAFLEKAAANTHRYTISYKDGAAVRQYASQIRSTSIMQTLDQHYFNHPISRFDKKYDATESLLRVQLDTPTLIADMRSRGIDESL